MGNRPKQPLHKSGQSTGQSCEKVPTMASHPAIYRIMEQEFTVRYYHAPTTTVHTKVGVKSWQSCGTTGAHILSCRQYGTGSAALRKRLALPAAPNPISRL